MSDGSDDQPCPSKRNELTEPRATVRSAFITAGISTITALLVSSLTSLNAQAEFMRNERSDVYADYTKSIVSYQNAINRNTDIIPDAGGIDKPEADKAHETTWKARENYVNTRTHTAFLQEESVREVQLKIDEKLIGAHNVLMENIGKNLRGEPGGLSNEEMQNVADANFNATVDTLRNDYVKAVRCDFHVSGKCLLRRMGFKSIDPGNDSEIVDSTKSPASP